MGRGDFRPGSKVTHRLAALVIAVVALLAVFGGRQLLTHDGSTTPIPTATQSTTASQVAALEARVQARPDDVKALSSLASAYLQRARETADPSFYALAQTASDRALAREPGNVQAIVIAGALALSRHDFARALSIGQQAQAIEPSYVATYGILTDANVELGRYDDATAAAQQLADLRPSFASLSRISYIRELHGDLDGAIVAMQQAVNAGSAISQDAVWGRVLLGNLYLTKNDINAAASQYQQAAALLPNDPNAEFGLARLAIARGDLATAEPLLRDVVQQRPLADYVITLGDLLWSQGRTREAEQQYATVAVIQQLFAAAGVDTDIELALFDADHDVTPEKTYETALAGYQRRPSVYAADTVAWTAFKAGRLEEARAYMTEAQRLGTRDPRFSYHAALIAGASGDQPAAQRYLKEVESMSPALSLRYAADARRALDASVSAR